MNRLSNHELNYFESTIAHCIDAEHAIKRAIYWAEDPEVLTQLAHTMAAVGKIRRAAIAQRDQRKQEAS